MRNRLCVLLALVVGAGLIAGCGDSEPPSSAHKNEAGVIDESKNPQYKDMLDQMKTDYAKNKKR